MEGGAFVCSEYQNLIYDLIKGTNLDYIIKKENEVIYTNLNIKTNLLSRHTKDIVRKKFVYQIKSREYTIVIFDNHKRRLCSIGFTLSKCLKLIRNEFSEFNDYKNHYFYSDDVFTSN